MFENFPDLLSPENLIEIGLYKNRNQAWNSRLRGDGPPFIKLGRKILYPKNKLIEFIELRLETKKIKQKRLKSFDDIKGFDDITVEDILNYKGFVAKNNYKKSRE